jgi:hypothetical protein
MELYCAIMSLWKLQCVNSLYGNVVPRRLYVPVTASGMLEFTCICPLLLAGRFQGEQANGLLSFVVPPHNIG